MFLPVLLVRDYGLWGWIVFAAPNVIGAAAMGWVMTRVRDPLAFERRHSWAMTAFSIVTIAFHLFFVNWMVARMLPAGGVMATLTIVPVYFAGYVMAWRMRRRGEAMPAGPGAGDVPVAILVLLISLVAWLVYMQWGFRPPLTPRDPLRDLSDLYWLAPVCVFGFGLCPYLDRTFHQAYRATRASGPARPPLAFAIGFGGFFLLMICFTLTYARQLGPAIDDPAFVMIGVVLWALGFHMTFQSAFTVSIHLRATPRMPLVLLGAIGLALAVWALGEAVSDSLDFSAGETCYRLFLAFYGLVFPAYVWLCVWRAGDRSEDDRIRALLVFAVAVLIAAPCYWAAFMERHMIWLVPGLAVVLLARLAVPRRRRSGFSDRDERLSVP
jgi:hypothetical protein